MFVLCGPQGNTGQGTAGRPFGRSVQGTRWIIPCCLRAMFILGLHLWSPAVSSVYSPAMRKTSHCHLWCAIWLLPALMGFTSRVPRPLTVYGQLCPPSPQRPPQCFLSAWMPCLWMRARGPHSSAHLPYLVTGNSELRKRTGRTSTFGSHSFLDLESLQWASDSARLQIFYRGFQEAVEQPEILTSCAFSETVHGFSIDPHKYGDNCATNIKASPETGCSSGDSCRSPEPCRLPGAAPPARPSPATLSSPGTRFPVGGHASRVPRLTRVTEYRLQVGRARHRSDRLSDWRREIGSAAAAAVTLTACLALSVTGPDRMLPPARRTPVQPCSLPPGCPSGLAAERLAARRYSHRLASWFSEKLNRRG
ncbi:hypothetical protein SKAU_G00336860 [Synaphobranchus kaupii]|uniref:Uncharacterized protein n=1 Tax=Synaphobranchus kaupii TaxID=118154 RepID=A0A9Q1EME8_SYNKA|nr:hypothetical protein SKAU_G00336860 [Synaphobranchus kaupii]